MRIAFLTCAEMPDMLPYDMEVISRLNNRNIYTSILIWDDIDFSDIKFISNFDVVIIRSIWDYYKKTDFFLLLLDYLNKSKVKVLNPLDVVRWNMDKRYLQELNNEGFDIIPTIFDYSNNPDSFEEAISLGWKKMIIKPMVSAGSYHTFVIDETEIVRFNSIINEFYINRPYMLQEFIPEISKGEISTIILSDLVNENPKEISYSVTKVPKEGDYRVQFNYGGVYSLGDVDPVIKNISEKITGRFNNKLLYQRLDGLWRNGKFLIMEIELIEPDLYLNYSDEALSFWVECIIGIQ
jgi:glutathione synthase/RimK-type ligase-like ATP-grasp enzyme